MMPEVLFAKPMFALAPNLQMAANPLWQRVNLLCLSLP
jgi:hypothetical protein